METNFDWDKWIAIENYLDVISYRPIPLEMKSIPTSVCPNHPDILYVNSIDESIDTQNKKELKNALLDVMNNYILKMDHNSEFGRDALVLAQIQYDFEALCIIIRQNLDDAEQLFAGEFESTVLTPKTLFYEMLQKHKPL